MRSLVDEGWIMDYKIFERKSFRWSQMNLKTLKVLLSYHTINFFVSKLHSLEKGSNIKKGIQVLLQHQQK